MRTLDAALLSAQRYGYPVGSYAPAVKCLLYSNNSATSYDYSFDPTSTTNRLIHVEQSEHVSNGDSGVILLQNYDESLPEDLTGYHVDIGWGLNTSAGIDYCDALWESSPRMWVLKHSNILGAPKGGTKVKYVALELGGIWNTVLNQQPVRLGDTPIFRYDDTTTIAALKDLTIYGVIKYLLKTALAAQTGLPISLAALGDQDDGIIDNPLIIPFPTGGTPLRWINSNTPNSFHTYAEVIDSLLELTKCFIISTSNVAFKIIYPQAADSIVKYYYSSIDSGHPYYEVMDARITTIPNHIEVFGGYSDLTGLPEYVGDWFNSADFSVPPTRPFTPASILAAYDGKHMPVTRSLWEKSFTSDADCNARALMEGNKLIAETLGGRIITPMDASIQLGDNIRAYGTTGNSMQRVSGITRSFYSGVNPVYQSVFTIGGNSNFYTPIVGERNPSGYMKEDNNAYSGTNYETWLLNNKLDSILKVFGKFPSHEDWIKWKKKGGVDILGTGPAINGN